MKKSNIIERVNTIQDVVDIIKPDSDARQLLAYNGPDDRLLGAKNFMLAEMIAEVLNEGSEENYWWGWFDSGSGFFSDFSTWYLVYDDAVSSRLRFKDEASFWHAVKTFPEVYKVLMVKNSNKNK